MRMSIVSLLLLTILPLGAGLAALSDLTRYQIPNWLTLGLAVAYPLVGWAAGLPGGVILSGVLTGVGVLVLTFGLFTLGWFGGGDAKLAAALAAWFGLQALLPFLLTVSLVGGVLAVALLVFRALPRLDPPAGLRWMTALQDRTRGVPYGIALGGSAILLYSETPVWLWLHAS
jgi:prepilin peptidase CpaA